MLDRPKGDDMKTRFLGVLIVVCTVIVANPASTSALFKDDFSGSLSAWELQNPGYWSIVNGWLDVDIPSISYTFAKAFAGDISWTDYRFEFIWWE